MIFVVRDDLADIEKVVADTFTDLNVWERKHVQEWIRQCPEILGEELLVLSVEFDRFTLSRDRLDVLALDRMGNLVVVELKRTSLGEYADLQAIRYAAMVSSMTLKTLLPYYMDYQKRYESTSEVTEESSLSKIQEFVTRDDFDDISSSPRIILGSEDFSQEITTTVLWLNKSGLDVSCVRIKPHKIDGRIVLVPQRIIPLQEAREYLIEIQKKEEVQKSGRSRYRPRTMKIILENNLLKAGDRIYLKNALPEHLRYSKNDPMLEATITGKQGQSNAIKWEKDQKEYAISNLTWHIFKSTHPDGKSPGGVNGNWHWVTEGGIALWDLAEQFLRSAEQTDRGDA